MESWAIGICVYTVVVLAGLGVLVGWATWRKIRRIQGFSGVLLEATRPYGGREGADQVLKGKAVEFEVEGAGACLSCQEGQGGRYTTKRPSYTRVIIAFDVGGFLRVRPQGLFMGLRKMFGEEDLRIGEPEFDSRFQIEASAESWARRLLVPEVRGALEELRRQSALLEMGRGRMLVQTHRFLPTRAKPTIAFVEAAVALYRALKRTAVPAPEARKEATGGCESCHGPLDDDSVACSRCGKPQHRDCWDNLGCPCGGRDFRFVKDPA